MLTQQSRIPYLPALIEVLTSFAINLLLSWGRWARSMFRSVAATLCDRVRHDPLDCLCKVDPARVAAAASQSDFLRQYDEVMARMANALTSTDTWFNRHYPEYDDGPVAYFCAEFGLHASVPIYSGGLGVL